MFRKILSDDTGKKKVDSIPQDSDFVDEFPNLSTPLATGTKSGARDELDTKQKWSWIEAGNVGLLSCENQEKTLRTNERNVKEQGLPPVIRRNLDR